MKNEFKTFGERLKFARKSRGLSQAELSKRAGISQPTISDIEKGVHKGTGRVVRLAEVLKVNVIWLSEGRGLIDDKQNNDARSTMIREINDILQLNSDTQIRVILNFLKGISTTNQDDVDNKIDISLEKPTQHKINKSA